MVWDDGNGRGGRKAQSQESGERTPATPGSESNVPTNGSCLRNVTTTGKKSLCARERKRCGLGNVLNLEEDTHAPEEVEETKGLDEHSDERPFEEDEEDATEEADGPANLLLAREEGDGLLGPNDECEA